MKRVKRKKISRKRKNPYLFTYGYHYTNEKDLPKILKEGLKVKENRHLSRKVKLFYGDVYPIFFFIDANVYSSYLMRHFEREANKNILLRVNIKSFNQLPDLPSFIEPGREFSDFLHFDELFLKDEDNITFNYDHRYKNIKYLMEMEDRDYLTLEDIKNYPEIQTDIINITGSFAITENIPAKYIEHYQETKIFNKDYWD